MFKFSTIFLIVSLLSIGFISASSGNGHKSKTRAPKYGFIIGDDEFNSSTQDQYEDETNKSSTLPLEQATASNVTTNAEIIRNRDKFQDVSSLIRRNIYNDRQLDVSYKIYTNLDDYHGIYNVAEIGIASLVARFQSIEYNAILMHRYDSFSELKESTGQFVNNDLCLRQLEQLELRAKQMIVDRVKTRDFNFYHLLDTYGKVPAGMLSGNLVWPGMYDACLSMQIELPEEGETVPTRYCLASTKYKKNWPKDDEGKPLDDILAFKTGICLPRTCDSLRYKNKYDLIKTLIDFNGRTIEWDETSLVDIYCLPDDDSPMRMWWKLPKTMQAILILGLWIGFVIYATIKYEKSKKKRIGLPNGEEFSGENSSSTSCQEANSASLPAVNPTNENKFFKKFAITHNFNLLFDIQKLSEPDKTIGAKNQKKVDENAISLPRIVNLNCLNGIKVICMLYLIASHVLTYLLHNISNSRELTNSRSLAYRSNNLNAAFAVNSFFTLTGILNCYTLLKANQSKPLVSSPLRWLAFIANKYLRVMPMYLVVVYYRKYLSKFTGSGPMWDYGTSSLGRRRQCEEESWLWTILFGANLKAPSDSCIISGWYLANDFQFLLVTPIFFTILQKNPIYGQKLLKFCILAAYLATFLNMFLTDVADIRSLAYFMPHGCESYITFFSSSYTRPLYRIPAYLCGLLFGYNLYIYEQNKLKYLANANRNGTKPGWSRWFARYGFYLSLFLVLSMTILPTIGAAAVKGVISSDRIMDKFLAALIMPAAHILIALATGITILLASTGYGNKFINTILSASFWKPWAKLSLCVSLINVEVITYILQIQRQPIYLDFFSHIGIYLLGATMTYLIAIVLHLLFEVPIKATVSLISARFESRKQKVL